MRSENIYLIIDGEIELKFFDIKHKGKKEFY